MNSWEVTPAVRVDGAAEGGTPHFYCLHTEQLLSFITNLSIFARPRS